MRKRENYCPEWEDGFLLLISCPRPVSESFSFSLPQTAIDSLPVAVLLRINERQGNTITIESWVILRDWVLSHHQIIIHQDRNGHQWPKNDQFVAIMRMTFCATIVTKTTFSSLLFCLWSDFNSSSGLFSSRFPRRTWRWFFHDDILLLFLSPPLLLADFIDLFFVHFLFLKTGPWYLCKWEGSIIEEIPEERKRGGWKWNLRVGLLLSRPVQKKPTASSVFLLCCCLSSPSILPLVYLTLLCIASLVVQYREP